MNRFTRIIKAVMFSIAVVCTIGISLQARGQNGKGTHNGHEYVDLGLPSGTLWATCNIGAGMPEAPGFYFAWGETQPKPKYSETNSNYSIYQDDYTKYYKYSESDHLTILQPEDDAATVQWGIGWHTPTYNEWNELIAYCTLKWMDRNGVSGMLVTAPNGNSLFFPAIGYRLEDESVLYGSICLYMSSALDVDKLSFCKCFAFGKRYDLVRFVRCGGVPVRAVCSAQ